MEIGRVECIPVVAVAPAVSAIPPSRVVRAGVSNLAGYLCYGRLPVAGGGGAACLRAGAENGLCVC